MSCGICNERKEKRFCPALHDRICPQCCGKEREVSIDCPSECRYLRQAREHEKLTGEAGDVFPEIEITEYFLYQQERLLTGLAYVLVKSGRTSIGVRDADLVQALSLLIRRYQTLVNSGLHYEAQPATSSQQAVADGIEHLVGEYRETERRELGYGRLRDADVLTALVFLVRLARSHSSGRPKSRAFLDFLGTRFPQAESLVLTPQDAPQIIRP